MIAKNCHTCLFTAFTHVRCRRAFQSPNLFVENCDVWEPRLELRICKNCAEWTPLEVRKGVHGLCRHKSRLKEEGAADLVGWNWSCHFWRLPLTATTEVPAGEPLVTPPRFIVQERVDGGGYDVLWQEKHHVLHLILGPMGRKAAEVFADALNGGITEQLAFIAKYGEGSGRKA